MPVGRGGGVNSVDVPSLPTCTLYSPQFRSHQETKMAAYRNQRLTSTISRENSLAWGLKKAAFTVNQ